MPDFTALLQQKLAEEDKKEMPTEEHSEGGETKKEEKSEGKKEPSDMPAFLKKKEEKKAEFSAFTEEVIRLTEKTAAIVQEEHTPQCTQLFRNMVSSFMNIKVAGIEMEGFDKPQTLVKKAYNAMLAGAEVLEVPLRS